MLTDRKAAILQAIVEGYISTSEPVGSSLIAKTAGLDVSSATVRSEMGALEEAGYLRQPHTSAGRVPSDKGYRYFVDSLMEPHSPGQSEQRKVSSFFAAAQGELERMLSDTSAFLANLTDYAAVVVGPPAEASPLRAVEVVRLSEDQAMIVVVHANAVIDKRTVGIEPGTSDDDLASAASNLSSLHVGRVEHGAPLAPKAAALFDSFCRAMETMSEEPPVFMDGTSTVAGLFDAVDQVQEVLRVLEKQYLVVTLVKDIVDRGLTVAIGSETGVEPLAECSLVVSEIHVGDTPTGTIGLLGPTHMNYPQAMATVALVSQQLGEHLAAGAT